MEKKRASVKHTQEETLVRKGSGGVHSKNRPSEKHQRCDVPVRHADLEEHIGNEAFTCRFIRDNNRQHAVSVEQLL